MFITFLFIAHSHPAFGRLLKDLPRDFDAKAAVRAHVERDHTLSRRDLAQTSFHEVWLMGQKRARAYSVEPRRNAVLMVTPNEAPRVFYFKKDLSVVEANSYSGHVRRDRSAADSRILRSGRKWRWLPECEMAFLGAEAAS